MSTLSIELEDGKLAYAPGEEVRGRASWALDGDPESVEVHLFWRTEGKGTQDTEIADTAVFQAPGRQDKRDFKLRIPDGPYSFAGKLIAILWSVEVVAEPDSHAGRQDIVVSPSGRAVTPGPLPKP
jgi:hypothetical protein